MQTRNLMEEELYAMSIWGFMFIWEKPREAMKGYSRNREDFIELLYHKYFAMEEVLGCLWDWAENTDYLLCNGDSDLLPELVKKDEIRFEYNQWANSWSKVSCTIFAAMWMLSDLINYEFSEKELKEVDELSYENWRLRWHGWYVKSAVKLVADRYNESELSKKYWKVAYYRISKYDNELIEWAIDKLYTIDWNLCPTTKYNQDYKDNWMVDGTDFWYDTNWHSIDVIKSSWQRAVKDSYKGRKYNIYWLKNGLDQITNFWQHFYIYTLVKEDNYERIKKLNEMKAKIVNWMDINSELWHLSGSQAHKDKLHNMNEFYRKWLDTINEELKKYM